MEPIAVVGFSFKMPQEAIDETHLWEVLESRKNLMTEWPETRTDVDFFTDGGSKKQNTLHGRGGHFLHQNPWAFDAPFFSITASEAAAMDPQQRLILETSYHAFENAGMPVESIKGSRIAVFEASMSDDYSHMYAKDPDTAPRTTAIGTTASIRANRVSWYFGLLGPSMHIDTACSSSLVALDLACQSIQNGNASAALVVGCNIMLSPEMSVLMSNMNFLSPDSVCYSFDHRANGYARGEGLAAIVIKSVANATQDGDMIRAVIRSIGSNQDGHTPILTQPSVEAQEQLIRQVYAKAGLDFGLTRYFEAHGTGTPTGDPIEMKAIGRVFRTCRSPDKPLYVGSIKSNIGHLEGGSGLAGIIKSILILEKGMIPPNALFEKPNPAIDIDFYHIVVPTQSIIWPTEGLRRISVNSFGIGGTNAHVILDDAFHYLASRGIDGHHQCIRTLPMKTDFGPTNFSRFTEEIGSSSPQASKSHQPSHSANGIPSTIQNGTANGIDTLTNGPSSAPAPKLLVWTAADENAITRVTTTAGDYYEATIMSNPGKIERLAYTLATRRTHMAWRTFAIADAYTGIDGLLLRRKPTRASAAKTGIAFVFTGQGAQYVGMGMGLMQYPIFKETLHRIDSIFASLGCNWSLFDAIYNPNAIDRPEYAQPLCTALQIALIELLEDFDIVPVAVVGHSSGEIAAAYVAGAISIEVACRIAYFRGQVAGKLMAATKSTSSNLPVGAMISANLSEDKVPDYLERMRVADGGGDSQTLGSIHVACVNSPFNCTLSGHEDAVDILKTQLDKDDIFSHKLNTGGIAYHCPTMKIVASEYLELLGSIDNSASVWSKASKMKPVVPMISSVTGENILPQTLSTAQYWVDNLVSTVRFFDAILGLTKLDDTKSTKLHSFTRNKIADIIEIGPHSALRRPIQDSLPDTYGAARDSTNHVKAYKQRQLRYHHVLSRSRPAVQTTLSLVGQLFCCGYPVSILHANNCRPLRSLGENNTSNTIVARGLPCPLFDLPEYPFDHTNTYSNEPRMSHDYRMRHEIPAPSGGGTELLGKPVHDWNPLEPRWRNFLSIEAIPWLEGHVVSNTIVLPGTAMLVMAIEATRQYFSENTTRSNRQASGFYIKHARFLNPIIGSEMTQGGTETLVHLRPKEKSQFDRVSSESEVRIFACHRSERWTECFRCNIQVEFEKLHENQLHSDMERRLRDERIIEAHRSANSSCVKPIDSTKFYDYLRDHVGVKYNHSFRILENIHWDGHETATASVNVLAESPSPHSSSSTDHPRHPNATLLDAAVHLVLTQVSRGLSGSEHTLVLQRVSHAWISAKLWEPQLTENASSVRFLNKLHGIQSKSGDTKSSIYGLGDGGQVLFAMEQVDMAAVARTSSTGNSQQHKHLLYSLDWKPQLSLLSGEQLYKYLCPTTTVSTHERFMANFYPKIESVMATVVRKTLQELSLDKRGLDRAPWMDKFLSSLQYFYGDPDSPGYAGGKLFPIEKRGVEGAQLNDEKLKTMLRQCEEEYPSWKMFPVVARNLTSLIRGDIDPIDLVFTPRLTEKFYASLFDQICDHRFQTLVELLCHENPSLRLLEVGSGTGGMTRRALAAFQEVEKQKGVTGFSEYTYTDISPAFFENARDEFKDFQDRIKFKKLDLEKDAHLEEGFDLEAYDVVIASSVIHATKSISTTLRNIRQLLKPNGYLIFLEIIAPDTVCGNAGFGIFPGWWLSGEDWRAHSPLLSEDQWDYCLKEAGFSGNYLTLRDYESDICHLSSIMVSKVVQPKSLPSSQQNNDCVQNGVSNSVTKPTVLVIVDELSGRQAAVANMISDVKRQADIGVEVIKWTDIVEQGEESACFIAASNIDTVVISLLEIQTPFLSHISKSSFQTLQTLIQRLRNLLWVTLTSVEDPRYPHFAAMHGFLRTMRSESIGRRIVSLAIETPSSPSSPSCRPTFSEAEIAVKHILTVLDTSFTPNAAALSPSPSAEVEYIVRDGYLTIGRLVEEVAMNKSLRRLIYPELRVEPWLSGPSLKLDVGVPGALDTLQFVEDVGEELGPDEIEIEAKVWPLSFRDVFIALGRMEFDSLGLDTAGIVTRVSTSGATSTQFQPGDRVCMGSLHGSMRMHPREPSTLAVKIPDTLSFEAAASTINPGITAYYGLIKLARLQKGDSILIHSAAGSTGQMALWMARMVGAEIFATVGNSSKRQLLVDSFNIPADHIFNSRDTSFRQGLKRMTDGRGVDVVFNSLSGEGLRASWECVAPFGRFVEIGKADIISDASLPMGGFAGNVSFFSVDIHHLALSSPDLFSGLMKDVLELLTQGVIQYPQPLHYFPVSEVEKAFRFMQSGKNTGRIIITADSASEVPKFIRDPDDWKFDQNASYLIPGGLGGIGRAIIRWMADKGAKYLILPSRSGLSPSARARNQVVQELESRGVYIATPRCDVASASSLSTMLKDCAEKMPPIRGCINAAMVLQDAVFENMKYDQWDLTLRSKIDTSWNLHQLLPLGSLDFFVFLASLSGIYGSIAQSNYAAGCTFQDALARQRASQGENTVSLDIGWMRTIGIIAETEEYQRNRESMRDMAAIEAEELLGLLSLCCNPTSRTSMVQTGPSQSSSAESSTSHIHQVLIGALTPAHFYGQGESPALLQRPMFSGFARPMSSLGVLGSREDDGDAIKDAALAFKEATGHKDRAEIVVQAITARLARALSVSPQDVEPSNILSDYGIDSLMAVELRNWIGRDFHTNVAVFDIMGGTTILALGDLVAERAEL